MRKKKSGNRLQITAIIVLIVLLAGVIYFLEKGLTRRGSHTPTPKSAAKKIDTAQLIRGCLFELGIERAQVEFSDHRVIVRSQKEFTRERLETAFQPVKKYGRLNVKDGGHVLVLIQKKSWEITFINNTPKEEPEETISEKYPAFEKNLPRPPTSLPEAKTGRLAIIIDDIGDSMQKAQRLASIDGELTFSILPHQQYSKEIATFLHRQGRQVMLHLPMQGHPSKDPGQGAIYKDMNQQHVRTMVLLDLRSVPFVDGVNNHMGSQITPKRDIMRTVCLELKRRGLFFIDSLTTSKSVAMKVARECGVPAAKRDVFLDNRLNDAYITGQIAKLKKIARKYPSAIAICHQHPETIKVLEREVPRLKQEGYRLVPASTFVQR